VERVETRRTDQQEGRGDPVRIQQALLVGTKSLVGVAAILIGVSLVGPLSCQELNRTVGFKTGVITTGVNAEVDAFLNTDWRTGVTAGGFVSLDLASMLTLQADLLFSQRGFGFRMYGGDAGLIPGKAEVGALEFHMNLGVRLPWRTDRVSPRVFVGPAVGYELSCTVNGTMMGMTFKEECDAPVVGIETHTMDLGFSFGGGVDVYLHPLTLVMDGRYTQGLRNLNDNPQGVDRLRSRAWSFTVGAGWPF
jgi:hypothetical protein